MRFLKKLAWSKVGSTGLLIYMLFLRNPPLRVWVKRKFLGVFGGGGCGVLQGVLPGGLCSAGAGAAVGSKSFFGFLRFSGPANPVKVSYYKVSYLRDHTVISIQFRHNFVKISPNTQKQKWPRTDLRRLLFLRLNASICTASSLDSDSGPPNLGFRPV